MKKFLALYNLPAEGFDAFKNMSEADQQSEKQAWTPWMEAHKDSFVDLGNPVGSNKRVTKGEVSDVRNEVGGYSIVQAEDHEAACAIFTDCPHLNVPGAYIEVVEMTKM
ncbi:hypothetical protein KTR10_01180 [Candidatus Kaiserbacteria bacterium]|nr:hypothetical protein [Candidatus Kaiserbacteria bacterium]